MDLTLPAPEHEPVRSRFGRKYAWKRDIPDQRDQVFSTPLNVTLPKYVDISAKSGVIEDQGSIGSCTAHALGTCLEYVTTKNRDLSRLFIYWMERYLEGDVNEDSGAMIRTGAKVCFKYGAPLEPIWPYRVQVFKQQPNAQAYKEATLHKAKSYTYINGLIGMKVCLAQGFPFAIGFTVYESFESDEVAHTGIVPLPEGGEAMLGGHAVAVVGYDDLKKAFLVRNSWGKGWGLSGFFWAPYSYFGNPQLASDAWTLR